MQKQRSAAIGNAVNPVAEAGQFVIVFQGGGALGAYQAGVYQALHEAGVEPDWIVGTSIGAINASLIAGNEPHNRLPALEEFWQRMSLKSPLYGWPGLESIAQSLSNCTTFSSGLPGFFQTNPLAFLGNTLPLGADHAGYYSTKPLEQTLLDLVDFKLLNRRKPRLTVGAAQIRTSQMRYFDSRETTLDVKHIMASGALPPAFPAVRIDGELYWDGGILSNTPSEVIFDDYPRRSSLIFAVHLWNPVGREPQTMQEVMHRQKDVQYSSRVANHIARQQQTHQLRHVIKELASLLPRDMHARPEVQELAAHGCLTRMHVVRLMAPSLDHDDQMKDIDFSPTGIRRRWDAGYASARSAITQAPWKGAFDPLAGVILHESADEWRTADTSSRTAIAAPPAPAASAMADASGKALHRSA